MWKCGSVGSSEFSLVHPAQDLGPREDRNYGVLAQGPGGGDNALSRQRQAVALAFRHSLDPLMHPEAP